MLETMLDGQVLFVVMGTLAAVGIISKCIVSVTLKRLVRAAGNMNKSNHPFMRLVRAKFEHASMISDKVENVDVFVDKYLYEYKVLGVRLYGYRRMETVTAVLCLMAGAAGAALAYRRDGLTDMVWTYGAAGAGLAVLVYLFHMSTDEKYQMNAVRNYMVDYLENVCRHRYEKEKTYQKGIKVLTQEGTAAEFGVMPAEDFDPEDEEQAVRMNQAEQSERTDHTERAERISRIKPAEQTGRAGGAEHAGRTSRLNRTEQPEPIDWLDEPDEIDEVNAVSGPDTRQAGETGQKDGPEGPYLVRTRKTEGAKSAVSTFHAAERIADEAISAIRGANEKHVSQSEPMGAILEAEARHSEASRENIAELPAAEFVRETMEPRRREAKAGQPKREKPGEDLDRDLVIRRILEEFMA